MDILVLRGCGVVSDALSSCRSGVLRSRRPPLADVYRLRHPVTLQRENGAEKLVTKPPRASRELLGAVWERPCLCDLRKASRHIGCRVSTLIAARTLALLMEPMGRARHPGTLPGLRTPVVLALGCRGIPAAVPRIDSHWCHFEDWGASCPNRFCQNTCRCSSSSVTAASDKGLPPVARTPWGRRLHGPPGRPLRRPHQTLR